MVIDIYVNWEWTWFYFSPFSRTVDYINVNFTFFVILSEKLANFCRISREIAKITGIGQKTRSLIYNWSETWFNEMLNIAFEREFSMILNSLPHLYKAMSKLLCMNFWNKKIDRIEITLCQSTSSLLVLQRGAKWNDYFQQWKSPALILFDRSAFRSWPVSSH